jgi:hypothetical protein
MLCAPAVSSDPTMSLFSSGHVPSCGLQFIIEPPSVETSFSWSDFPVVVEHCDANFYSSRRIPSPFESSELESRTESITPQQQQQLQQPQEKTISTSSSPNSKRVSFSSSLEIRTHSLTLGDHPCCSALPLQLGWEYDDTELVNLDIYEQHKAFRGKVNRLTYLERKNLLKRVSGMCDRDLKEPSTCMYSSCGTLRHAPSQRELCALAADCI